MKFLPIVGLVTGLVAMFCWAAAFGIILHIMENEGYNHSRGMWLVLYMSLFAINALFTYNNILSLEKQNKINMV